MQSHFTQCFLASLATLASFVRADYYIDDQNYTSLLYSANPRSSHWLPYQGGKGFTFTLPNGTDMTAVASNCYNSTYTIVGCTNASLNCKAQIPFSGSGITIYVLQAGVRVTNASLTIDGGAPAYNVLDAPPAPNYYVPNVTLFNVQGMTTGDHTAIMTVQSSYMMFDYALINQTTISLPTTSTSSVGLAPPTVLATTIPEPTATSTIRGVLPLNVSATVGGVLGGMAALILAILCFRRRHRKEHVSGASDHVLLVEPFVSATQRPPPSVRHTSASGHAQGESTATSPVSAQAPEQSISSRSSRPDKSLLSVANPNTSQFAEPTIPAPMQGTPSGTPSEISHARIRQAHPMLTDDQADFVNGLYINNVPAAAVARVIERMMAGEQRPAVDECDSLPPPSYYHDTNNG